MNKPTLAAMIEFHRARLVAVDNWATVEAAMMLEGDRVAAIARDLGVSDLGAQSVLALAGGPIPNRSRIASELNSLEYLQRLLDNPKVR